MKYLSSGFDSKRRNSANKNTGCAIFSKSFLKFGQEENRDNIVVLYLWEQTVHNERKAIHLYFNFSFISKFVSVHINLNKLN